MSTVNPAEVIAEALANGLLEHIDDYRGTMPGGYDDLDGLAEHLAAVIAALPDIAIVALPADPGDGNYWRWTDWNKETEEA